MESRSAEPRSGLVRVVWAPARREPDHRSEMVTQWLCGEKLDLLDRGGGWVLARDEDGYRAWTTAAAVLETEAAGEWAASAGWSLGTAIEGPDGRCGYLPWGGRVRAAPGARLELPDGTLVAPARPEAVLARDELERRFPPDPPALVGTARRWTGVPYAWGGRTDTGCDCSGFVQTVFATHGTRLPRDSADQSEIGPVLVDPEVCGFEFQPADLLFFAPEEKGVTHVAISTGGHGIIHCCASRGDVSADSLCAEGEFEQLLRKSLVRVTRPLETLP